MPSFLHEALVALFRANPGIAARMLRELLGMDVPEFSEVRLESGTLSEMDPAELRADAVTVLRHGTPVLGIVVEVQLQKQDGKHRTWLGYTAGLMRRLACNACTLVVTPYHTVASWAKAPLEFCFGSRFAPLVVGPSAIPIITDRAVAKQFPELAILSAIAHARDEPETAARIAGATLDAALPFEDYVLYYDLIDAALSDAARKALAMLPPNYEFQNEALRRSMQKGKAEGLQQGKAEDILAVLEARTLPVSPEQRSRILATSDLALLDTWLRRAAVVANTDELFA